MNRRGLSLVEVIIALAVVAIAFAILSTALVGQMRFAGTAGARTQTTQYLNYFGRLVAGGDGAVLPDVEDTPLAWGYGTLETRFPDLPGGSRLEAADRYRVLIDNVQPIEYVGATGVLYRITVCSMTPNGESCAVGATIGPEPPGESGSAPPLPGIN